MLDTLERQAIGARTTPGSTIERADVGFRGGYDAVPVMSLADDRPSKWIGRLAKSAFAFVPPLKLFKQNRPGTDLDNARLVSSSRPVGDRRSAYGRQQAYDRSPYLPEEEAHRRRGAGYWATFLAMVLFLGLLIPPLGRALGEEPSKPAVVGRSRTTLIPPTTLSPPSTSPTVTTIGTTTASTMPNPTTATTTATTITDPPITDPPITDPPTTPPSTIPVVNAGNPIAQVLLAALAGMDVRLALGVGDKTCNGVQLGSLVVGCTPPARSTLGVTGDIQVSQQPPIHLSVPSA